MPPMLSLNELSCRHPLPFAQVDEAVREFVSALREARRVRPGTALVTPVKLPDIELAPGYPMARWAADGRNKDLWRLIRAMQARAPYTFDELVPPNEREDSDYLHEGASAVGLGIAHSTDGIAVSLPAHTSWSAQSVRLTRVWIDAEDDEVDVRHASNADHIERHGAWFADGGLNDAETGRQLWDGRVDFFPCLTFLPGVEQQLVDLPPVWVRPVLVRLAEIQEAVARWDPASGRQPVWGSKVTPEHEQRKRLCEFSDFDDVTRVFDLHARFTPGHGRVHFRLVGESGTARIAYVGRKLGV